MSKYFKWAELPARTDVYQDKGTTKYGNHDLYPIPLKERTYGRFALFLYWTTAGVGLSTFSLGSSYIVYGLTAGEAVGAVLIGACIASMNSYLCGAVGAETNLGYTMMARTTFGLRGLWVPLVFQLVSNIIFFGIQAVYGGQAISLMLGAIIPQYKDLANTLPASAGTTSQGLLGFFLYVIIYLPCVFMIKPHKMEPFLMPTFIAMVATFFGLLGWAVTRNGGSPGNLVAPLITISSADRAFRFIQCISSVCGTYAGAADRFADWTRFAKNKNSHIWGSTIALPLSVTLSALIGVLVTSATTKIYGTTMWNPLVLLLYVQAHEYTSACRAATFFAGLAIFAHQMFVNVTQNNYGAGMDLAGLFPRYISMKRGSILLCIVGIVIQPWRFLSQATTFITVISSFGVISGPAAGILISDYWIVRKKMWKIPDLYQGGPEYIYWFTGGFNPRAVGVFLISIIPSFPGLVQNVMGMTDGGAVRIYQLTYPIGFFLSMSLYLLVNKFWPPVGLGIQEGFSETEVIESCSADEENAQGIKSEPFVGEKQKEAADASSS